MGLLRGRLHKLMCTQQSDYVMLSESADSMRYSTYCTVPGVVCHTKAKSCTLVAAAIGNMQFFRHGGWANPYLEIPLTF